MLLTAIAFLIILSVLVLVHELGHFLVARAIGVDVEEFGLGLPPRALGKKIQGTIYSLNWLPIGGFVKLAGEDDDHASGFTQKNSKNLFWARSKKERAAILLAGVAMNFFLAVGITAFLLTNGVNEPSGSVHVERTLPNSPAERAGFVAGDIIIGLEKYPKITLDMRPPLRPTTPLMLIEFVNANKGKEILISFERNGALMTAVVVPRTEVPAGEGPLGIAISDLEFRRYTWQQAPMKALEINLIRGRDMLVSLGVLFWRLITLQPLQADVAGPIGIAHVTGQAVKFGVAAVLEFMGILSLNLAVLNVLPIPALDGGRLAFVFLEKILGRRIRPAFEKSTHQIGMIILFALILLISINDILRLVRG